MFWVALLEFHSPPTVGRYVSTKISSFLKRSLIYPANSKSKNSMDYQIPVRLLDEGMVSIIDVFLFNFNLNQFYESFNYYKKSQNFLCINADYS